MTQNMLAGKKGLVIGIANDKSIAWGCASVFHREGAEQAVTYLNPKAEPHVRPLADRIAAPIVLPLDVRDVGQMDALFEAVGARWGQLDFLVHAIAFAPKDDLHGRVVDSTRDGFLEAIDISCHSFLRAAKRAEPLMKQGGSMLTMTYDGSRKVVEQYSMMGPVKAALESAVKYMASELGPKSIRVNAISPGPIQTRAASGILNFQGLLDTALNRAPSRNLVTIEDIGELSAFLVSDRARHITGTIAYVDAGLHVMGL
ncbi:MAG TPA: enoyl-ACP reductase FabI [Alphaproteobacteria bacterium]|nr:enoyl-ACP reductase FabI [Alphaproteobacteria bacterium]